MKIKLKHLFLNCTVAILAGSSMLCIAATSAPKEIDQFIPVGAKLVDYKTADLNEDGKDDALVVIEKITIGDDSSQQPRTVLVLIRTDNDQLVLAEQNSNVYLCKKCLGSGYVNEQVVTANKGTFNILNQGGSPRYRWTRKYTFQYDLKVKTWFLSSVETFVSDENDEKHERSKSKLFTYPKNLKKIKFSQFSPNTNWNAKF